MANITTWVVIADSAHVRIYESHGVGQKLIPRSDLDMTEDIPSEHELTRDKPARSYQSTGSARHAAEPRETERRKMKRNFAETLAKKLDAAVTSGACKRLIVAAPPAMIGDLREAFTDAVQKCLITVVPKDLVKIPPHELPTHLEGHARI